jgi:hypothetical protein
MLQFQTRFAHWCAHYFFWIISTIFSVLEELFETVELQMPGA